ncbi:hypothetical protein D9M71_572240 [compost metagenome]
MLRQCRLPGVKHACCPQSPAAGVRARPGRPQRKAAAEHRRFRPAVAGSRGRPTSVNAGPGALARPLRPVRLRVLRHCAGHRWWPGVYPMRAKLQPVRTVPMRHCQRPPSKCENVAILSRAGGAGVNAPPVRQVEEATNGKSAWRSSLIETGPSTWHKLWITLLITL